ncbi:unnamed protein product [Haemonchus placei]|uniref:Recep_L_domain domain-containing protein n=1 Tax=Haemonchus placei TaxID=6290 RepID=A0A0N4WZ77_HAEPC|nr:unnamed protein product [Haemonchus placei]
MIAEHLQKLKKITGCLDIVGVEFSMSGKFDQPNFEELDLTNLTEIDYVAALCENVFALNITKNKYLRRIDFNENLILNGHFLCHFNLRSTIMVGCSVNNVANVELSRNLIFELTDLTRDIYIMLEINFTSNFLTSVQNLLCFADCLPEDPTEKLRNCTGLIGPVHLGSLSPTLYNLLINKTIKRIHGQFIMMSTDITDLEAYGNLTIIAHNSECLKIVLTPNYFIRLLLCTQPAVT